MQSIEDILRHAHLALCKAMGVCVTYSRGEESVDLIAVPGSTPFRYEDMSGTGAGGFTRVVSRDYLVLAERLALNGQHTLPVRGDRITESGPPGLPGSPGGGVTRVYEVLAPLGSNEPEWRWSDPYRVVLRLHTQEVEESESCP